MMLKDMLKEMVPSERVCIYDGTQEVYRGYAFFADEQAKDYLDRRIDLISIECQLVFKENKAQVAALQNELQDYPDMVKRHEYSDFYELVYHKIRLKK